MDEICFTTARDQLAQIRARTISVVELLEAHLRRIEQVNPQLNAIVTLEPEPALAAARAADAKLARGEEPGLLGGLPVAHKDLFETQGMRTTFGSPIFADFVPDRNALIVERLRAAGAISIGKTNTPEFGAGSQTFNPVFGATRNPYNPQMTCGGSSGGAAVALASGMISIADGSDMGGSLRNPAGFCGVAGLRSSPGRVPVWPDPAPWLPLNIDGPMARNVGDLALVLAAIAGPDPRVPLAISEPGRRFAEPLDRDFRGVRVAWSPDLGGLPIDPQVAQVFAARRADFVALGCNVEQADPDLRDADEVFMTLRALRFELSLGQLLDTHRDQLKDTVVWNIEEGRRLSGPQVGRALRLQAELFQRLHTFFETYDFLVLPVSQVPPFPVEQPYVTTINGVPMQSYIEWMRSCYLISATSLPALAVPGGLTSDGLPVGLQIVGRYRDELGVLQLGYAYEQVRGAAHGT
jgi:amidase